MKRIFAVLAATLSLNAFAEAPKEPVQLAGSYDPKAPSISVQGLGNQIIDKASSAKYIVFEKNGIEYAYSVRRLEASEVKYIGNRSDIDGLIFLDVTGFKDGYKFNTQLTVYRPSKYKGAIKFEKFDRNEEKPYQFDLGIDSQQNLMGITNQNDVVYFSLKDSIKQPKTLKEKSKINF